MIRSPVDAGRPIAPKRPLPRRPALLAGLLLLAACGPTADAERRLAASPPLLQGGIAGASAARFADSDFIADDGARLPLRTWLPKGPVLAVVLALHGFGDYSNAFAMPAARWAERGIATYAFDQRGFGAAPNHGLWAGERRLTADAIEASRLLRRRYPGRPLYLLGESMGGAVALLAMTGARCGAVTGPVAPPVAPPVAAADGVILSAPAIWGRPTMALLPRLALFVGVRLFPDMILTGRGLHIMASDNIAMLRALARDPLVLKGARVDTVYGLVDLMDDALGAAPRLDAPVLVLYGAHDEVIPRQPMRAFVARLPADPAHRHTLGYYANGYHLLLRDLDGAAVAGDVASWILDRGMRLPSKADAAASIRPWPPAADGD